MSIKFEITKQNNIHFGIAAVAAALVGYFTSASWWVILLFAAAYFGLINVKLELPVKLSWLWAAILLVIGAILSVFSVQYVLLTDEDFVKTTDMVCVVNVVLALAIYLVILFITNNTRLTCTIASIAILAFGFIDYFVYEFRGNEFTYADLKSAGTGLSVVTKYKFVIDYKFFVCDSGGCFVYHAGKAHRSAVRVSYPYENYFDSSHNNMRAVCHHEFHVTEHRDLGEKGHVQKRLSAELCARHKGQLCEGT